MYEGYATFGGIEVINNERAVALTRAAGIHWYKGPRYPMLAVALEEFPNESGASASFGDITNAPWYDPDFAVVSSEFHGIYGLGFTNMQNSQTTVPLTQRTKDGGVLGMPRRTSRGVRVRAFMLASSREGYEYGRAWLASILALEGYFQVKSQNKGEVQFFVEPPADPADVEVFSRYLKETAVTSGPFDISLDESNGVWGSEIEWAWTSQKSFVYGPPRVSDLEVSPVTNFIYDAPINAIPYPSAELADDDSGDVFPTLATNMVTNPDLETVATGWTGSATTLTGSAVAPYFTSGRATSLIAGAALGTASFLARVLGNNSTAVSGTARMTVEHTVTVSGAPAGRRFLLALWADTVVMTGDTDATITEPTVTAIWRTAGDVDVRTDTLTLDERGLNVYSFETTVPATATKVVMRVTAEVAWSSGATDALNTDARLSVDALTVAYLGGA